MFWGKGGPPKPWQGQWPLAAASALARAPHLPCPGGTLGLRVAIPLRFGAGEALEGHCNPQN